MVDISHVSPLVASGHMNNPFQYCNVVTAATQKGLRWPRGALIFYRRRIARDGELLKMDEKINFSVFPMLQGGPHNHTIAGIAFALKHAKTPGFAEYTRQVFENSQANCAQLQSQGFKVPTDGTYNHIFLVDLRNKGVNVYVVVHMCDLLDVSIKKNAVFGDRSPLKPSGIHIGAYAVTSRGLGTREIKQIASIISDIVDLCGKITRTEDITKTEFKKRIAPESWMSGTSAAGIRERVQKIACGFPIPEYASMYKERLSTKK